MADPKIKISEFPEQLTIPADDSLLPILIKTGGGGGVLVNKKIQIVRMIDYYLIQSTKDVEFKDGIFNGNLIVSGIITGTVDTASYVDFPNVDNVPDFVLESETSSMTVDTASYVDFLNVDNVPDFVLESETASMTVLSSSHAVTSSYVDFPNVDNVPDFSLSVELTQSIGERVQEIHKVTISEGDTIGVFTLTRTPVSDLSVKVYAVGGPLQINSSSINVDQLSVPNSDPDFKMSGSVVGINDNASFVGTGELSEDIKKNDVLIIEYQAII